jgi:glycosyltransferase involved in cell wall biosynthesis
MEGRLKILMTADTVGGVWTYTVELCRALQEYDAEVHLMTMGALLNDDQNAQVQQLKNVYLYESNYKLEWMQDPWQDVENAKQWVQSVYDKILPDLIHFNNYGQTDGRWDCPVLTVFHSCVQTWWEAVKGEEAPQEWERYKELVEKALRLSDVVVAPTAAILQQAEAVYGTFSSAEAIYNGRSLKACGSLKKEPYILSAGRVWDEAKNIKLLSDIGKQLEWPVYIAGHKEGPDGQNYQPENVRFLGHMSQDDLQHSMERASVFVMPAKYEPFGLAVLEAANAGCALALSNIETLKEIWGDAAVYFDPSDKNAAKETIQKLIEDEDLRHKLAAKAVIRAKDFTAKAMAEKYIELYRKLVREKHIELTNQHII